LREAHSCSSSSEWSSLKRGESGRLLRVFSWGEEGNLIGEQAMFINGYGTFSSLRSVNYIVACSSDVMLISAFVNASFLQIRILF
jgi:hypothetical protein